jgi:predicted ATPase
MAAKEPKQGWEDDLIIKHWFEQRSCRGLIVLIENPEAHLHPRGQTALGRLIALGAKCGVQFVIETQSDHLMDGIRIAVKDGDIEPAEVMFHYFTLNSDAETQIETPEVYRTGKLSSWPEGFFDQTLKNRIKLAR